ncbi:MAG: Methenyltetrahydromethanopterin cyclohydrolase [Promethearchaeota archaeon]|nr:MAG: Methenyltetrahydromethanopterin cyclohydrolase [Candidatus Lokiarchaeota archaeon]
MKNLSVNDEGYKIVEKILQDPDFYSIKVSKLSNKATIIDGSQGTYEFGRLVGEVCLGGLGSCKFINSSLKGNLIPSLLVETSHPPIALVGSQKAIRLTIKTQKEGKTKKRSYLASGPFRAKARLDQELYDSINYFDDSTKSVMVFEESKIPNEEKMEKIFEKCKLDPEHTVAIFTPTNSIPGSVQIAARIIKTGLHILREQDFDPLYLKYAMGTTTIAPVAKDEVRAMGRTNDSIIYGGKVYLTVEVPEEEEPQMVELLNQSPSSVSPSYGKPFYEMLKEVDFDFYKIDGKLFAPAIITINNLETGKLFTAGNVNEEVLWSSYFN